MQQQFKFGTSEIPYTLLREIDGKSVKISVEFEHGVEVVAPNDLSQQAIEDILHKKGSWIIQKLDSIASITTSQPLREFVSGEKFLYLGRHYTLVVEERAERRPYLVMRNSAFEASIPPSLALWERQETIRRLFQKWYQKQAEERLTEQVRLFADRYNLHPSDTKVIAMDRRWGSCTPRRVVQLNWRLIMAPIRIIDYLAVHELCHLDIPDHSDRFWRKVASILPDYKERREWLRVNGPTLTV